MTLFCIAKKIAIWLMAFSFIPILGATAWVVWQHSLIDVPILYIHQAKINGDVRPGEVFSITWRYTKTSNCQGDKVVSLYHKADLRGVETYTRISQINALWARGDHEITEYYYAPYWLLPEEQTLVIDAGYWCNFYRHVGQHIDTGLIVHVKPPIAGAKNQLEEQ